jgi:hypothetical protein
MSQKQVCRYFLKSGCNRGAECKYTHEAPCARAVLPGARPSSSRPPPTTSRTPTAQQKQRKPAFVEQRVAAEASTASVSEIGSDDDDALSTEDPDGVVVDNCWKGARCLDSRCQRIHPPGWEICEDEFYCSVYECTKAHVPGIRPARCSAKCTSFDCPRLHPKASRGILCLKGIECREFDCALVHPPGRPANCRLGLECGEISCDNVHPTDWNPCPEGRSCPNPSACGYSHPIALKSLKSFAERQLDRSKAALPIFQQREAFLQQLKSRRFLIVVAGIC